jgi:hypothetical protein
MYLRLAPSPTPSGQVYGDDPLYDEAADAMGGLTVQEDPYGDPTA